MKLRTDNGQKMQLIDVNCISWHSKNLLMPPMTVSLINATAFANNEQGVSIILSHSGYFSASEQDIEFLLTDGKQVFFVTSQIND
jgi:hypothetical protein